MQTYRVSYRVEIPGLPRPWTVWVKRSRQPQGFINMQAWQLSIQRAIKQTYPSVSPITGLALLSMIFRFPIPSTCPKTEPKRTQWMSRHPPGRGDLRNYEKAAEDALQGLLMSNDSHVVESWGMKEWLDGSLSTSEGYTIIGLWEIER